ncbi:multi-sensor signal transduction histidine kinase [Runella slithyformis DSM 19594]|uniref:histidine kinase n=2 Tax=Runella TaxID=105 RepID=A0A7U3ZGM5_RUNSL|nr:multi-sensor signal transduction histidine kinase [Runella slithyformis DSM 19594]
MRMKSIASTLILCFVLLAIPVFAQQTPADSLKRRLSQAMPDTARVLLLDQLSYHLMYSKPWVAMQHAREGLELAQKINFPKGKVRNMNRLGSILRITSNYGKALEMLFNALKLAESIHDEEGKAKTLNNIGILYLEQKDSKKAIEYFLMTKAIAEKINDRNLVQIALVNIGTGYALQNNPDSAQLYVKQAYQSVKDRKGSTGNTLLISLGNIHYRMGEYPESLKYYRLSLPYLKAVDNNRLLSQTYFEMAQVFQGMKRLDSCLYYAERALTLAQSANNIKYVFEAGHLLASLYETRDKSKAFDYFKLAAAAKDSMFNQEKVKQVQNLSFREQLLQQELIATQKEFAGRRKLYVLFGVLAAILIFTGMLYRNNRLKNKANELLRKQKEAIQSQKVQLQTSLQTLKETQNQLIQKEKLAGLGELTAGIAHEIQNPLNFVNNFSDISAELVQELKEIKEDKKLKAKDGQAPEDELEVELLNDIEQNLQKIHFHGQRASGIVKNMLEHSRAGTGERAVTDLNKLAEEYLRLSYHGMRAKDKGFTAGYAFMADETLPSVQVVPQDIGRVLLNLFNNAFYAVGSKAAQTGGKNEDIMAVLSAYQPMVTVSTKALNDWVEIRVQDNGTGIPAGVKEKIFQPFFTTKPTGEGTGLGLSLSYDIITKGHGGTIEVEAEDGEGTAFVIKLPIRSLAAGELMKEEES